jgi:Na+/melibiose symporter-like transporter
MGISRVFSAFSYFFQTLIFVIVWSLTGYIPAKGANQTELAKIGLKLIISIIPFIITLIGVIIFAMLYTITKEQSRVNIETLKALNL